MKIRIYSNPAKRSLQDKNTELGALAKYSNSVLNNSRDNESPKWQPQQTESFEQQPTQEQEPAESVEEHPRQEQEQEQEQEPAESLEEQEESQKYNNYKGTVFKFTRYKIPSNENSKTANFSITTKEIGSIIFKIILVILSVWIYNEIEERWSNFERRLSNFETKLNYYENHNKYQNR